MINVGVNFFGLKERLVKDYDGTMDALVSEGFREIEPLLYFEKDRDAYDAIPGFTDMVWNEKQLIDRAAKLKKKGLIVENAHFFVPFGSL